MAADNPQPKVYKVEDGVFHITGPTVVPLDDGVYRIGVITDG